MIRVLMIDDNKELINMIKEYFKDDKNISIELEAYDGLDGIKIIEKNQDKYDVILLDLIMPLIKK